MTDQAAPASLIPTNGWHCTHYYYSFDRSILANLTADQVVAGAGELAKVPAVQSLGLLLPTAHCALLALHSLPVYH